MPFPVLALETVVREGSFTMRTDELGTLTLTEVWPLWWKEKQQEIGPKTARCYREYSRPLLAFFGALRLSDIHIDSIVTYRANRQTTAGPNLINHEINALKQLLEYCGLWEPIARYYKQLKVKKGGPGQVLTDQEAEWIFQVAEMKPRWRLAYLCALVSATTGAGATEVLSLRLKDVDFNSGRVGFIESQKTDDRPRLILMNDDCRWALAQIVMLAHEKGAERPEHFIFPKRAAVKGGKPDPTQHMASNFRAWYAIRKFAAKKYPNLAYLGRNKLRHYALTKVAENPNVSEMTVKQMAGHGPYSKMLTEHYVHIREQAQRVAVDSLQGVRKAPTEVRAVTSAGDERATTSSTLEFAFRSFTSRMPKLEAASAAGKNTNRREH
jgi:integrase